MQVLQLSASEPKKRAAWWPAALSVIAAVHSWLTVGYAYGYTSTALEQLSELPDGYAFRLGSISADLFAVSSSWGLYFQNEPSDNSKGSGCWSCRKTFILAPTNRKQSFTQT